MPIVSGEFAGHAPRPIARLSPRVSAGGAIFVAAVALVACSHAAGPTVSTPGGLAAEPGGPVLAGFVAFGDFGGGAHQAEVATAMERWAAHHRVDALVTTGDNVYDHGDPDDFAAQLDAPYRRLRQNRPLWVTLGNHDVRDGNGPNQLTHLGLPALPYTRQLPGIDLFFLDGNHPDATQTAWLATQLTASTVAFQVVVFHQPAYSCSRHDADRAVHQQWVPVLERLGVELVLNGHDHNYQRFHGAAGTTYVVTGAGGKSLYAIDARCDVAARREAAAARYHFVAVEARADTLTVSAVAESGRVFDRAVLADR